MVLKEVLMLAHHRYTRLARSLLPVCICLLALSALPTRPASAATITKRLDDSLAEFTRGTFQRAALTTLAGAAPDQSGAVQLMPVSVIKNWLRSSFLLPEKLSDIGAAAIGNNLFSVGGLASNGVTPQARTKDIWSVVIDPATGAPSSTEWYDEAQDLPAVLHSNQ